MVQFGQALRSEANVHADSIPQDQYMHYNLLKKTIKQQPANFFDLLDVSGTSTEARREPLNHPSIAVVSRPLDCRPFFSVHHWVSGFALKLFSYSTFYLASTTVLFLDVLTF